MIIIYNEKQEQQWECTFPEKVRLPVLTHVKPCLTTVLHLAYEVRNKMCFTSALALNISRPCIATRFLEYWIGAPQKLKKYADFRFGFQIVLAFNNSFIGILVSAFKYKQKVKFYICKPFFFYPRKYFAIVDKFNRIQWSCLHLLMTCLKLG